MLHSGHVRPQGVQKDAGDGVHDACYDGRYPIHDTFKNPAKIQRRSPPCRRTSWRCPLSVVHAALD